MRSSGAKRNAVRGTDPDSKSVAAGGAARYSDHVNPLVIKSAQGEADTVSV